MPLYSNIWPPEWKSIYSLIIQESSSLILFSNFPPHVVKMPDWCNAAASPSIHKHLLQVSVSERENEKESWPDGFLYEEIGSNRVERRRREAWMLQRHRRHKHSWPGEDISFPPPRYGLIRGFCWLGFCLLVFMWMTGVSSFCSSLPAVCSKRAFSLCGRSRFRKM